MCCEFALNIDDPFAVLVLVLVLEPQVLGNNTWRRQNGIRQVVYELDEISSMSCCAFQPRNIQ